MLPTRQITIAARQPNQLFQFFPELAGGAGELLLKKTYSATTGADGVGSISLPCSTGGIKWTCRTPSDFESADFEFTLAPGAPISLDALFLAGLTLPSGDPVYAYIDAAISQILDRRATTGQFGLARADGTTILSDNGLLSVNPDLFN